MPQCRVVCGSFGLDGMRSDKMGVAAMQAVAGAAGDLRAGRRVRAPAVPPRRRRHLGPPAGHAAAGPVAPDCPESHCGGAAPGATQPQPLGLYDRATQGYQFVDSKLEKQN